MVLDGQNYFSDLANGDAPTLVADNVSAYVIDQQVKDGIFTGPAGSYVGMWLIVRIQTAGVSGGGGSIQAVLQDSPDNVTYTDAILGPVTTAANALKGTDLMNVRILPSHQRYMRVVYRITTAVFTAGKYLSFLTPDRDVWDLSERKATGFITEPTGAMNEAVANGVLAS